MVTFASPLHKGFLLLQEIELNAINRRAFVEYSLGVGAGFLLTGQLAKHDPAVAEDANEERKKEALASYSFSFSSPYYTSNHETTPHAHREIKRLVEQYTNNKVHVKLHDGGSMGIGSALANSVRYGLTDGALLSASNLSPLVNEFDVLNIPFWSANEDEYVRLFSSSAWDKYVLSKTSSYKLRVLFPYVVGARTAASTKQYGKRIVAPEDFAGLEFRIPGSKSLGVFYQLAKANPRAIPWRLCAKTARKGRYQALDPSTIGLYSGPDGLNKELGVISEIETVHDGWVAIANTEFIESLDPETRTQFLDSFQEIQSEQVKLFQQAKNFCTQEFAKLGTEIYTPTQQEKNVLAESFGHTNPAWLPVKKRLLGDDGIRVFDELSKIAKD